MQKDNRTWLAAVSGGPDSMALLHMCLEQGIPVAAAHVNYHHRKEAEEEEAYLREYCRAHHIPLFVRNEPFVYEGNFEAAARTYRYDFFVQTVRENGYAGILIGHQEDDLIETYIMQKEKNLTPAYYGLKEEMTYRGVMVRRPLLSHTKAQLAEYCRERGIRYFIDATNASDDYTRNRIRHEIVEKLSAQERKMIRREIDMENAVLQERRCRVRTYIRSSRCSLADYRRLKEEDRIAALREMLENPQAKRTSDAHLKEIDSVLMKKDDFIIPLKEKNIVQENGSFFLHAKAEPYSTLIRSEEELMHAEGIYWRVQPGEKGVFALTLKEEDFPLTVRSVRDGDEIAMHYGTKKVHRFFIDRHIPLYQRELWPVVENAEGTVILVPGLGCDRYHFSMRPDCNVLQYFS